MTASLVFKELVQWYSEILYAFCYNPSDTVKFNPSCSTPCSAAEKSQFDVQTISNKIGCLQNSTGNMGQTEVWEATFHITDMIWLQSIQWTKRDRDRLGFFVPFDITYD